MHGSGERTDRRSEIGHLQYLTLMAACLVLTLPLEFVLRARIYRRPLALGLAVLPVVIIFSIWDVLAIAAGHWRYNPRYVTGIQLGFGLPLEEVVFFVVIPICGLLTYGAVGFVLEALRTRFGRRTRPETGPNIGQGSDRASSGVG